jgi:PhoPQ-activated pathogenicity-related protein
MKHPRHPRALFAAAAMISFAWFTGTARCELLDYVKKPDKAFSWKLKQKTSVPQGTIYEIALTSQTWEEITWEHELVVYQAKGTQPTETLFLWNTGGKPNIAGHALGLELAGKVQAPVAFLYGIPNQPLFDGKKEDALIAETFVRFLKTKDEDWPLLFPMVKSLVKAMDALQAFADEEWKQPVKQFVVSGASKRGWTSWLTAAADPRVKAVAPLVIDTLNMREQLPHQVASFGKPSEMIADYIRRGLVPIPDTAEGTKLWRMVDPFAYRDKLALPKMIINGANDPYWSQDALNLYWDDLKGDKWVLYVPNAGHGLEQKYADGHKDRSRALNTLSAFARCEIIGKPMPKLRWKHDDAEGKPRVVVESDVAPKAARLWVADASTRDFRQATWAERPATLEGGKVSGSVELPEKGWRTFFAECEYEIDGLRYYLSTQVRMLGK